MNSYYLSNVVFFGFAIYSIFFIIFKHFSFFKKKDYLIKIDHSARIQVGVAGCLYALIWIGEIASILLGNDESNRAFLIKRMFGAYAFGFWLQPLCSILFSQLVWFKKIANRTLLRIIIAFFLFIDFEKLTIVLVTIHRDYLPSSWDINEDFSLFGWLISSWIIKLVVFSSLVTITYLIINRKKI